MANLINKICGGNEEGGKEREESDNERIERKTKVRRSKKILTRSRSKGGFCPDSSQEEGFVQIPVKRRVLSRLQPEKVSWPSNQEEGFCPDSSQEWVSWPRG